MRTTILAAMTAATLAAGRSAWGQHHPAGEVVMWGPGATGPMLPPASLGPVVDVWATSQTVFARRPDGSIVAWGDPSALSTTVPANVGDVRALSGTRGCQNRIMALRSDGTLVAWGAACYWEPNPLPQGVRHLADGSAGAFHVVARHDDSLSSWGYISGTDGMPASVPGVRCIAKSQDYVVAARGDGSLVTWGWGPPAPLAASPARKLIGGTQHIVSLREDGTLFCWADHLNLPVEPPPTGSFEDASAGGFTFVARRADGSLAVWGRKASEMAPPAGSRFSKAVVGVNVPDHPADFDDFPFIVAIRSGPDGDQDGTPDEYDNCPNVPNQSQSDCDNDGIGDACEPSEDYNDNGIPDYCECIADLYVDGVVNGVDLGALLAYWGPTTSSTASQRADLNRDGAVDGIDLGYQLSRWGPCTN